MALFPVSNNVVQLQTATPTSSDQFSNGVRLKSDASAVFAATSGGGQVSNGLLLDANGAVVCVDATSGLPAGVQYVNGLPISSAGALCVSTNAVDEWINGLPFDANGALSTSGVVSSDPFFANVSLLLSMNGTNGSTTFTDLSSSPKTITVVGNAQVSTAQTKFGGGSLLLDGTDDSLTTTQCATGTAWTVEGFFRCTSILNTMQLWGQGATSGVGRTALTINNLGDLIVQNTSNYGTTLRITADTWHHIAVVATGSNLTIYLDGVGQSATNAGVAIQASNFYIGANWTTTQKFIGNIEQFRVTNASRYTGNFTPPTAPFPTS